MLRSSLILAFALCFCSPAAMSQGLRVSTVVYDAGRLDASGNEPVLSNSFSLFHNGRVYDYVEAAGEVVIFEPTAKKFTILNRDQGVFTNVAFTEVRHLLKARSPQIDKYLKQLKQKNSSEAERAARTLSFQLRPQFENQFDGKTGRLALKAPSWKYTVSTREWEDGEQLQRYINYTDWTARLNCVLHPGSTFPEPRLALNQQLRELNQRMPVVVQLDRRPDERMILRAEHQFVRGLTDHDHQLIAGWEKSLRGTELKKVPFRSYQEATLVSQRR